VRFSRVRRSRRGRSRRRRRPRIEAARARRLIVAILAALAFALVAATHPARAGEPAPADSAAAVEAPAPPRPADRIAEARSLADRKRFEDAAAILRGVVREQPGNTTALSLLARVLAWDRRYDESIQVYDRLLPISPNPALDRAGYARVLAWSGRYVPALHEFRRSITADSTNLETRVGYARAMSWAGDLAGASREYLRILDLNPRYGDAWLGLSSVARWRGAAAASDRFLLRAEEGGADADGVAEERQTVARALAPRTGGGFRIARERQYVSGTEPFTIESSGPFAQGAVTLGRTVGLRARVARDRLWERRAAPPGDTTLNYDLRASVFSGDLALLRFYPLQLSAGATFRRLESRSGHVLFPPGADRDFFGPRGRIWGYWGRLTPSASVSREFLPLKRTDPATGAGTLDPGGVTSGDLSLGWQIDHRWSAEAGASRGFYSDDNRRWAARAGGEFRARLGRPRIQLEYVWSFTDFDSTSRSYFTPLNAVRHAAGVSMSGWAERASLDWGARYQFTPLFSSNFPDLFIHSWSGWVNLVLFGSIPAGVDGYYSIDNNQYTTWGVTASASLRW
jgi:tetratricopeptide (TPR) repeat protein